MNAENYYNKTKLVKVSLHKEEVSDDYYYHPGIKFLGITLQKRGVYDNIWNKFQGVTAPENHTLVWNDVSGTVWRNPFMVLYYEAGHSLTKNFENDSAARSFLHKLLKGGPFTLNGL